MILEHCATSPMKNWKQKKKKIVLDIILNMVAGALPIITLQLFVFPIVARVMGGAAYGTMLTIVSVINLVSNSLGNVLNNVRLLRQNEYAELLDQGDFNLILVFCAGINAAILIVTTLIYCGNSPLQVCFTVLAGTLHYGCAYLSIQFRLELNYNRVLVNNCILIFGYLFGFGLFYTVGVWQLIYIVGNSLSVIYILSRRNLLKEPWKRTPLFNQTVHNTGMLFLATLFGAGLNYLDKIILYPVLGGTVVSVYYAASTIGKICSMAVTPISSVMLSYLSKATRIEFKQFWKLFGGCGVLCVAGYWLCCWVSRPILQMLYPIWVEESMQVVSITTATAMLALLCSLLNPIILRFCEMRWQLIINAGSLICYAVASLILVNGFGLAGFCFGILISHLIKLISMLVVLSRRKNNINSILINDKTSTIIGM